MKKFMNQSVFDVCVVNIALQKLQLDIEYQQLPIYQNLKTTYWQEFQDFNLCENQIIEVASFILRKYDHYNNELPSLLRRVDELRQQLDDDMNKKSSVSKIFNGSFFSKSHSQPFERENTSKKNISELIEYLIDEYKIRKTEEKVLLQCPQCSIKFKVPLNMHLEITCRGCGLVWSTKT